MVDGENNPVSLDIAYAVGGGMNSQDINNTLQEIIRSCPQGVNLLPLGGKSAGSGVFQCESKNSATVVGIQFVTPAKPAIETRSLDSNGVDLKSLCMNQIIIDETNQEISMGAPITLGQINEALGQELGTDFKVMGADLTSYAYAQSGATFMTGGMGPQRIYFSDSVVEIILSDGISSQSIKGDALCDFSGTYGWSGLVTAVKCRFHRLPPTEIALAIPVSNEPEALARLLAHLAPLAYLDIRERDLEVRKIRGDNPDEADSITPRSREPSDHRQIRSLDGGTNLVLGLEHVTTASMQPLLRSNQDNKSTKGARRLVDKCTQAGVDGLIFVSGNTLSDPDSFLVDIIDDIESPNPTIAGIDLTHTEVFEHPEDMRELREAIPFAARTQMPSGTFLYKDHTDANIRLNRDQVRQSMEKIWQAHMKYVQTIEEYFHSTPKLQGQILIYGHLNPVGVDPHNRITFSCDDETVYHQAISFIHREKNHLLRKLRDICTETGSVFVGGEKSAGSEFEMSDAFGSLLHAPHPLSQKYRRQKASIETAPTLFSWRAKAPYHPDGPST